ncbi:NUDIX hydrolase [Kitasatospora sp. NPDC002965]|uniref:NUDIX hydrolase n=1 Tax=Kitasatospora sp. NPDC002965 TaxID=3154775 RepID=UPI0033AAF64D
MRTTDFGSTQVYPPASTCASSSRPSGSGTAFAATVPHHITSAGVLLADDQGRILMLRQAHGYPGRPAWWQIPDGLSDPDETPPATVLRELREEAGIHHHQLRALAVDYRTLD